MLELLKNIVEIRSGHTFRGKIPEDPRGNIRVLQIRDLRTKTGIISDSLSLIRTKDTNPANYLQSDDVVMPARGERYNAVLYVSFTKIVEPVIASNQVFILRAKTDLILPKFLCWYLNQDETQNYLRSESRGTNIPFITRESLSRIKVKIPDIDTQEKIIDLIQLCESEKQLTEQLIQNRQIMLKGMVQQLLEQ